MSDPDKYAVFGNPVRHSRSPWIHEQFAQQCGQQLQYRAVLVETTEFSRAVRRFFEQGGKGLNITVPFKQEAFALADQLGRRALRAGAVNTLSPGSDGSLLGDNTDGVGLIRDMVANLGWQISGRRVLLLGAGGAARGVLEPLLRDNPKSLLLVNRTAARAETLAAEFEDCGEISGGGYELLDGRQFDLVINATSASLAGEVPPLPPAILTERSHCYDMMYAAEPTPFMRWAAQHAAWAVSDGIGMLVEQAAESFYIWRGLRPQTAPVLAALRARISSGLAP